MQLTFWNFLSKETPPEMEVFSVFCFCGKAVHGQKSMNHKYLYHQEIPKFPKAITTFVSNRLFLRGSFQNWLPRGLPSNGGAWMSQEVSQKLLSRL